MNIKNKTVMGYGISIVGFLLLWLCCYFVLPNKLPLGTVLDGAIVGALSGLTAMGLVLVYKSARIINFAQAELGGVASTTAVVLVLGNGLSYVEAILIGLASAIIMGILIDRVIISRFQHAPRLILTVATIGLAQLFEAAEYKIPTLYGTGGLSGDKFNAPFHFQTTIGGYVFTENHLLAVIVIPIVMLLIWWFLAKTDIGIGIRASSDSADRALLLGIPVRRLSLITWVVASVLSAIGAILSQPIQGIQLGQPLGPEVLLTPLAAAAIARFEKLPLALYASIFIGIFEQAVYWSYPRSSWIYIGLFALIAIALFTQRQIVTRIAGNELGSFVNIKEIRPLSRAVKKLPAVRALSWITIAIAAIVVIMIPHLGGSISNASNLLFFTDIAIYGMIAISLVVLTGWAGQISLGQWAFTGAGAAAMGLFLTSFHFPILPAMLLATIVGALIAIIIGIPALRTTGLNLAVMTLAFAVMLNTGVIDSSNFPQLTPSQFPTFRLLGRFDLTQQSTLYYFTIIMLFLVIFLTRNLQKTRSGRIIRAVRDNYRAAASYGASPLQVRLIAFGFAGAIAGLAGSLYALSLGQVPAGGFDPAQNLTVFTMVIFGGMGSILGGFLGAIFVEAILFFWKSSSSLEQFLTGAGLLGILYIYPAGLGGFIYKIRDAVIKIFVPKEILEPDKVSDDSGPSTVIPGPAHDAVVRLNALEELELKTKGSQGQPAAQQPAAQDFSDSILAAIDVDSGYDKAKILFDVSFGVKQAEVLALLGTNGAGKSTILKVFAGILPAYSGKVMFMGEDITKLDPISRVKKGIVMVPGGRGVFPTLTVKENLYLASWINKRDKKFVSETMAKIFALFPILQTRKDTVAGLLSGGEQQMLTIAQALLCKAKVILIDELSLGLAPTVVAELLKAVESLAASGVTVVVVEQSVNVATAIASRAVFMERGQVRFSGPTPSVEQQPNLLRSVFLRAATKAHSRPTDEAFSKRVIDTKSTSAFGVLNVTRRFGTINVLNDVSLSVSKGEILGIIGANGAGKTTLFDVCSGFLAPNSGKVILDGNDVTRLSAHMRARRGLGRVFQDAQLFPSMTVSEVLSIALERHVEVKDPIASMLGLDAVTQSEEKIEDRVEELLEEMGLNRYRSAFVTELSTGTRRVLDLACSMAHRPRVLLLDEPSAGIAQRESEAMGELILGLSAETGASFIIIEHDVPLVSYVSDRLICLHLGQIIAEGNTTDVLANPDVISAYLGRDDVTINRSRSTVGA